MNIANLIFDTPDTDSELFEGPAREAGFILDRVIHHEEAAGHLSEQARAIDRFEGPLDQARDGLKKINMDRAQFMHANRAAKYDDVEAEAARRFDKATKTLEERIRGSVAEIDRLKKESSAHGAFVAGWNGFLKKHGDPTIRELPPVEESYNEKDWGKLCARHAKLLTEAKRARNARAPIPNEITKSEIARHGAKYSRQLRAVKTLSDRKNPRLKRPFTRDESDLSFGALCWLFPDAVEKRISEESAAFQKSRGDSLLTDEIRVARLREIKAEIFPLERRIAAQISDALERGITVEFPAPLSAQALFGFELL